MSDLIYSYTFNKNSLHYMTPLNHTTFKTSHINNSTIHNTLLLHLNSLKNIYKILQNKKRYHLKYCIIKKEEELIMPRQKTHHTKQFKLDAINYRKEHPDLTQVECAKNLGIGFSTLARWEAQLRDNDGDIPVIGSGAITLRKKKNHRMVLYTLTAL